MLQGEHSKRRNEQASRKVVYVAVGANLGIASAKWIAALLTRSSAMLAEAVHSTVDTGNELLLLWGMKRSVRPPDPLHPYGHGKVLYFYSLLVAVYIFSVGGGVAIYDGFSHLRRPHDYSYVGWSCAVLGISMAFDLYSWFVSYKELHYRKDPDESIWDEIIGSKDPTVFTVFLEDSAGLVGSVLALLGIVLGAMFHNPYLDPLAPIMIGLLLLVVAIVLARESGALLVGERTNRGKIRRVKEIISGDPSVDRVGDLLTMQLGPDQVLLTVDIRFNRGLNVQQLENAIDRIEQRIREAEPSIGKMFIEADSLKGESRSASEAA